MKDFEEISSEEMMEVDGGVERRISMSDIEIKNIYLCGCILNAVVLISACIFYYFGLFNSNIILIAIFVLGIIGFFNLSVYRSILAEEKLSTYSNLMVAITIVAASSYILYIFFMIGRMTVHRLGI